MVFFGESYNNVLFLASLCADKLVFKARNKGAGTQLQVIVLTLAAFKCNAVNKALKVDDNGIILLCRAGHFLRACQALCHAVEFSLYVCNQNLSFFLLNRQALVIAQCYFRLNRNLAYQYNRAVLGHLGNIYISRSNCLDTGLLQSCFICLGIADIQCIFKEHAIAVQAFNHLAGCLAFAEARNRNAVAVFLVSLLLAGVQFFSRNLNGQSNNALFQLFNVFQFHYNLFLLKLYPTYFIRL